MQKMHFSFENNFRNIELHNNSFKHGYQNLHSVFCNYYRYDTILKGLQLQALKVLTKVSKIKSNTLFDGYLYTSISSSL